MGYTALVVGGWRALYAADWQPLVRDEYAKHFTVAAAVDAVRTSPQLQTGYGRTPPAVDMTVDSVLHSEYLTATRL